MKYVVRCVYKSDDENSDGEYSIDFEFPSFELEQARDCFQNLSQRPRIKLCTFYYMAENGSLAKGADKMDIDKYMEQIKLQNMMGGQINIIRQ